MGTFIRKWRPNKWFNQSGSMLGLLQEWRAALIGGFYDPLQEKVRKSFLHLPFLKFLHLKYSVH